MEVENKNQIPPLEHNDFISVVFSGNILVSSCHKLQPHLNAYYAYSKISKPSKYGWL